MSNIKGGKIKKPKSLKQIGRDIDKGWKEKIARPANKEFFKPAEKALQSAGSEIGKFTNEKLLPTIVSTGIPLVSTALGALGTEMGLPPEITSSLSEGLMKEFIPKQYQTDNKYVGMLGDALNMGMSGNIDQNKAMNLGTKFLGSVGQDILKSRKIKQSTPTSEYYDPENPYDDIMRQIDTNYATLPDNPQTVSNTPSQSIQASTDEVISSADYKGAQVDSNTNTMSISSSPFQQKEGSLNGLLGAGLKKRRGRKPKKQVEVYVKEKLPHQQFTHSKNASLDQLLEAKDRSEKMQYKNAVKSLIDAQLRHLNQQGGALSQSSKPLKGSVEMKEKMARLRALKRK